jgi:hypothetical protein
MALTQMQLIQSLGEAMSWFERELSWGVPPTELRHLCGRIGELYAAVISNGQMAQVVNQKGYDVVGSNGERISVKTTAMMNASGHISFNANSLAYVDRVIILRMNTDEMQIETLLDAQIEEIKPLLSKPSDGKWTISLSKLITKAAPKADIATVNEAKYEDYLIKELESGSIEVLKCEEVISPAKPALREIASKLNIGLLNAKGNALNTRQLGTQIIRGSSCVSGGCQVFVMY